jgi:hypothetical protein
MAVKKKRGAKASKAKKQAKKSSKLAKADTDINFHVRDNAAAPRDPTVPAKRAQLASKGRAVLQRARTAEREQRRLHGATLLSAIMLWFQVFFPRLRHCRRAAG